ncbi:MAG TPA: methyltransferase [Polyangiales bacterium]|nr:methyltransferase [Polyangiales bacterium]
MTHDRWTAGDAYEVYMGRWSRALARVALAWLGPQRAGHWLELGCGTGALTAAICESCEPASVIACDPSAEFIEHARRQASSACTFQVISTGDPLPTRAAGFDSIISGLVLNFVPAPERTLAALRERVRPGGTIAAYVWDYADGMEFLRHFWTEVVALDPNAAALDEGKRFGVWQPPALAALFRDAGLERVETASLEIPTDFESFEDYWSPFLGGSGPAPGYVATLDATARERLKRGLEQRLPKAQDGHIRLRARAFAVRGISGAVVARP